MATDYIRKVRSSAIALLLPRVFINIFRQISCNNKDHENVAEFGFGQATARVITLTVRCADNLSALRVRPFGEHFSSGTFQVRQEQRNRAT